MAILSRAAAMSCMAVGCYAPELRDCAVSCANETDCAPGQVCGPDQLCAAPALAGRCAERVAPDAAANGDPRPHDAAADATIVDAQPDAAPSVQLRVEIHGHGKVVVAGHGTCFAASQPCTYAVPPWLPVTLTASAYPDAQFDKWQDACAGQGLLCTLVPAQPTTKAKARFENDD
jgi:hypothetical protein